MRSIAAAFNLLIKAGQLQPREITQVTPVEEPVEDTRPRGRDGKVLTPEQLNWASMRQFAETASMAEVNARKASDPVFAAYVRKAYEAEMSQEVGDAVVPAGQTTTKGRSNQESRAFAEAYARTPSSDLFAKGGFVVVGGQKMSVTEFETAFNKAVAAGEIR